MKRTVFLFLVIIFPVFVSAQVEINEIMYDLEGADSGREWVEVFNNSTSEVNIIDWKFNDGSNHILNEPPKNGGKGSFIIPAGGYAVFADNAETFFNEHPDYNGILIDTVMSLNNTSGVLKLFNKENLEVDSVSYDKNIGGVGDGNSLQKINGKWIAASLVFGSQNIKQEENKNQDNQNNNSDSLNNDQSSKNNSMFSLTEKSPQYVREDKILFKESKIKAYAGENKLGISGADIIFIGEAVGLKDYSLDSVKTRYVWNFGDGSYFEGKVAKHSYFFPGSYIAVLDISSGEYSASDRITVKVLENEIVILDANPEKGWIKIFNNSLDTIDISFWQISLNGRNFIFPKNTFLGGKKYLALPKEISNLDFYDKNEGEIKLLYPNNILAYNFNFKKNLNKNSNNNILINTKNSDKENKNEKRILAIKNAVDKLKKIKEDFLLINNNQILDLKAIKQKEVEKKDIDKNIEKYSFNTDQTASVILTNNVLDNNKPSKWKWVLIASFLILFSGAGFFIFKN